MNSLSALPDYDELMESIKNSGKFNTTSDNIYEIRNSDLYDTNSISDEHTEEEFDEDSDETPSFLKDEDVVIIK